MRGHGTKGRQRRTTDTEAVRRLQNAIGSFQTETLFSSMAARRLSLTVGADGSVVAVTSTK